MAAELDQKQVDKLAAIVKKEPGNSEKFYSDKSGIPMGQILRYLVVAELKADPSLKIAATPNAITQARNSGLRWPRIAARAGVSEAKAKELFEQKNGAGSAGSSYTGRGRPQGAATGTSGRRSSGASKPASRKASNTGTSGRRGSRGSAPAKPASRRGTRGTRSSAKAADPK